MTVCPELAGAVISNTLSEECGDILRFYGEYRSADYSPKQPKPKQQNPAG